MFGFFLRKKILSNFLKPYFAKRKPFLYGSYVHLILFHTKKSSLHGGNMLEKYFFIMSFAWLQKFLLLAWVQFLELFNILDVVFVKFSFFSAALHFLLVFVFYFQKLIVFLRRWYWCLKKCFVSQNVFSFESHFVSSDWEEAFSLHLS